MLAHRTHTHSHTCSQPSLHRYRSPLSASQARRGASPSEKRRSVHLSVRLSLRLLDVSQHPSVCQRCKPFWKKKVSPSVCPSVFTSAGCVSASVCLSACAVLARLYSNMHAHSHMHSHWCTYIHTYIHTYMHVHIDTKYTQHTDTYP
jgi:hypothetical protein